MKKMILILILLTLDTTAFAYCTNWTQTHGTSCVFNSNFGSLWERQCTETCQYHGMTTNCNYETFCAAGDLNPNQMQSSCTDWVAQSGTSCRNPNSGDWEQSWIRSCQTNYKTEWCSKQKPNF